MGLQRSDDDDEAGFDGILRNIFGVDGKWMIAPEAPALQRAIQVLDRDCDPECTAASRAEPFAQRIVGS